MGYFGFVNYDASRRGLRVSEVCPSDCCLARPATVWGSNSSYETYENLTNDIHLDMHAMQAYSKIKLFDAPSAVEVNLCLCVLMVVLHRKFGFEVPKLGVPRLCEHRCNWTICCMQARNTSCTDRIMQVSSVNTNNERSKRSHDWRT